LQSFGLRIGNRRSGRGGARPNVKPFGSGLAGDVTNGRKTGLPGAIGDQTKPRYYLLFFAYDGHGLRLKRLRVRLPGGHHTFCKPLKYRRFLEPARSGF